MKHTARPGRALGLTLWVPALSPWRWSATPPEVKAGQRARRADTRPLTEVLGALAVRGVARDARRLGLVVTRGREVEPLAPGVWAVPDWRLFGPGGLT
ncbi:MAG: hypothetical protein HYV93_15130 [Candidatus Rokubacteria bacterium]|nr:hypothetical protein [Candidatus Rokubacteria bacterium]